MSIILTIIQFLRHRRLSLPWQCVLCHSKASSHYSLCLACEKDLPILSRSCRHCARILTMSESDLICSQCILTPPPIERTYAVFRYENPIIQFIISLKFNQKLIYAHLLGHLLIKHIEEKYYLSQNNQNNLFPDLLLPVPLHKKRLQHRGFNQALEITRPIAKKYQLPIDTIGVQRIRATDAQSHLSAHERKKNMAGAFVSCKRYDGLSIAIIDDVMTTTHTVFELAKLLKQQGASQIVAWVAARTDYR